MKKLTLTVYCLAWGRPIRTLLTISSLIMQRPEGLSLTQIRIVDQGSRWPSRIVYRILEKLPEVSVVMLTENVGMSNGWKIALEGGGGDLNLLLENDWFSLGSIEGVTAYLENVRNGFYKFMKLRSLSDIDNFGKISPVHSPYNLDGYEHVFRELSTSRPKIYEVTSEGTDFTFNPILFGAATKSWLIRNLEDDMLSEDPKRSGESVVDSAWRTEVSGRCLVVDGPFRHTGFYGKHYWLTLFPFYIIHELRLLLRSATSSSNLSKTEEQSKP